MDHAYNTLSLAKAYESQGYYQDAKDIYDSLNEKFQGKDTDIQAACIRMKKALENVGSSGVMQIQQDLGVDIKQADARVADHLEEWIRLLVLQKRLGLFRRIQARVV
ncbi:MAG: hypothetical protein V2J08_12965 [Desulfotignum sp.]|jgi:hypothetical protein|nr:hypothetical protein [Desulfotignum sp.]